MVTVDGAHFAINEPKPFDERWYSHKYKGAGLSYELAVCIQTGHIVWINGPFPASWHDLDIFHNDLRWQLEEWEMVEADNGYSGDSTKCKPRFELGVSRMQYRSKSDARAAGECINGRFKNFGCLNQVWRHTLSFHSMAFRACAVITELSLYAHPTWNVPYGQYPFPGPVHPLCFPKEGLYANQVVAPWPFLPEP